MASQCTTTVNHTKVKVEEHKRKAVFCNPTKIDYHVTDIDGCLVQDGIRTDYLVSESTSFSALVELKGSGVEHACNQLFASVEHESVKMLLNPKLGFLVICSKYPRFDTYVAKAKSHAAKKYKSGFHVVCDKGEFNIEDIVAIA